MNMTLPPFSRRAFLRAGVLCFGFNWLGVNAQNDKNNASLPGSLKNNPRLDAWINLHPDSSVTMLTGKVELGQGILTALTQIVADELDVELKNIKVVSGHTDLTPDEGVTSGSLSIQDSGTALRFACAEIRNMLIAAGAKKLNVSPDLLQISKGKISVKDTSSNARSVNYTDLLSEINYSVLAKADVAPKKSSRHQLIGTELARRDIPGKVSGQPMYVQDLRLPNMVHARTVRPPSPRAQLMSVTTEDTLRLPGVIKVVVDGSFLAVVATREEQAIKAAAHLRAQAQWKMANDLPPSGEALFEYMFKQTTVDDVVSQKTSAVSTEQNTLAQSFKQRYTRPYIAHASIGPSCALALWERPSGALSEDHLRVWCHSQGVYPLRNDLSKALRVSKEHITVAHVEGSGCYGHNAADDVALDAALIARHMPGVPIRLQWMREDEFGWEPLGSPMVVEMSAQMDSQGFITNWQHELWSYTHSTRPYDPDGCNLLASWYTEQPLKPGPSRNIPQPSGGSDRNAIPLYDFQNHKVINHLIQFMPIRTSALRTLGAFCNVLAIESFLDELAFESGQDPVDIRLKHLSDPRAKAVIEDVAKMADWRSSKEGYRSSESGSHERRAKGIAFAKYKNMAVYCAVVAQVYVDLKTKTIRVEKAFASVDAGLIINPNGLKNQIEGGLVQATSWSLFEQMSYDQTQLKTKNWGDYPILRFNEVPEVVVSLINRPEEKSLGVGEGAHGPMAAAIANAVFAACGERLRSTPFKLQNQLGDQNKK